MLIEKASNELSLSTGFLEVLGRTATFRYREYKIPKRSGGMRTIHHPAPELKLLQRWIAVELERAVPVHDAAFAYVKGKGIGDHARVHIGARYLLRLDLRSFFPSLRQGDVNELLLRHNAVSTLRDLEWASAIVCRFGRLTIGAPSSPGLSNMLCYDMDVALSNLAVEYGAKYSRYADDLYFSSMRPNVLADVERNATKQIEEMKSPSSLVVNKSKTRHSSWKRRMRITGLLLTQQGGISIGRARKRNVRTLLHCYSTLDPVRRRYLAGYLAFVRSVEPEYIDRLYVKYGAKVIDQALSIQPLELKQD